MSTAAELEARIARGESYLKNNPNDAEAKALYWRLTDEYVRLMVGEEDRLVATLEMPAWVSSPDAGHVIRVCLEGNTHEGELTRDDLSLLVLAMSEGQKP